MGGNMGVRGVTSVSVPPSGNPLRIPSGSGCQAGVRARSSLGSSASHRRPKAWRFVPKPSPMAVQVTLSTSPALFKRLAKDGPLELTFSVPGAAPARIILRAAVTDADKEQWGTEFRGAGGKT